MLCKDCEHEHIGLFTHHKGTQRKHRVTCKEKHKILDGSHECSDFTKKIPLFQDAVEKPSYSELELSLEKKTKRVKKLEARRDLLDEKIKELEVTTKYLKGLNYMNSNRVVCLEVQVKALENILENKNE